MQGMRNSSALEMELRLICINSSTWSHKKLVGVFQSCCLVGQSAFDIIDNQRARAYKYHVEFRNCHYCGD